jgi:hypothetical protein
MVGFPQNPAMASLEAFILLQSLQMKEEESLSSCSFVAVAMRIAQAMGLHRDPADFGLDPVLCEERRRIWRYLMHLDAMTPVISGLSMTFNEVIATTGPIGELRDELIGQLQLVAGMEDRECLHPGYVLAIGRYDVSSCIREVLNMHISPQSYNTRKIEDAKKKLGDLKVRVEERIEKLLKLSSADTWHTNFINGSTFPMTFAANNNAFFHWAADLLRMQVDRIYGLLYMPLMHDQELWTNFRSEAIPHYQSYLRIFASMINNTSYTPFHWLYPGIYQPLNQVCVLLVDMLRRPDSPEVTASRLALEPIFSCLSADGRVFGRHSSSGLGTSTRRLSSGARVSWARLEALRCKVWKVLNIDSSMTWSPSFTEISTLVFDSSPESLHKSDLGTSGDGFQSNLQLSFDMASNSFSELLPMDLALVADSFSWSAPPT